MRESDTKMTSFKIIKCVAIGAGSGGGGGEREAMRLLESGGGAPDLRRPPVHALLRR